MVNLLHTGGELGLASSVYNMYVSAQAQRGSRGVHGHVSAAHDGHLFARRDGGVIVVAECLHQVASGQILIGGEYAVGVLSGDAHELGKSGAGAHEHSLKAFLG